MQKLALDLKIEELLRLRAKVKLYKQVQENVEAEMALASTEHKDLEKEYPGLLEEFVNEITLFCNRRIEDLGNGPKRPQAIDAVAVVPVTEEDRPAPPPPAKVQPNLADEPVDPLKFLLKWRHLDSKRVKFKTKDGEVEGTVRGMVTPFLRIQTDTGYDVNVKPQEVQVI